MTTSKFTHWAKTQQARSSQYVSLHNILFGIDQYRYFIYRTRYIFLTVMLRVAIHIAELLLVINTLPNAVHLLMAVRLSSMAIEGAWWGATEPMRKHIRWLRKEGSAIAIRNEIEGWISLSVLIALSILSASLLLALTLLSSYSLATIALVVTIGLQTAIRVVNRTFYSGAYAIRRVFLPVELVIVPELIITIIGFLLFYSIGEWSVATCTIAATTVGTLVCYHYVKDVTDFLRITPQTFFSYQQFRRVVTHHRAATIITPSLAALCMRIQETLLIITIQVLSKKHIAFEQLLFPMYIVMPLIRGAASWGQVTYFDLSKYGMDCMSGFRNKFERICLEFSFMLSLLFSVFAALLIYMFARDAAGAASLVILPHLIVSSAFGFVLVALFARHKYWSVAMLSCVQYSIFIGLLFLPHITIPLWLILITSSVIPLIIAWIILMQKWQSPDFSILVFPKWVSYVRSKHTPLTLIHIKPSQHCTGRIKRKLVRLISHYINNGDFISIHPKGDIYAAISSQRNPLHKNNDFWIQLGGGYIAKVMHFTGVSGDAALGHFLPNIVAHSAEEGTSRLDILTRHFKEQFPEGVIQFPMKRNETLLHSTDSEDRRIILQCARTQLEGGRSAQPLGWDVTIGTLGGMIACIFLLPRTITSEKIKTWHSFLATH